MKRFAVILMTLIMVFSFAAAMSVSAYAEEPAAAAEDAETAVVVEDGANENSLLSTKAMASAIVVGVVGAAGAIAMGMTISKSAESMARQPEASGKINSAMMLGLVFIETAIIYALVIAILVIFVL